MTCISADIPTVGLINQERFDHDGFHELSLKEYNSFQNVVLIIYMVLGILLLTRQRPRRRQMMRCSRNAQMTAAYKQETN